jgi:hypothetical protein
MRLLFDRDGIALEFISCQENIGEHESRRGSTRLPISGRTTHLKLVEPPSCSSAASTIVFIGRDKRGNWVAQEQNGFFGGLFVSRAQAIKYALFENGNHRETIVEFSRQIELEFAGPFPQAAGMRRSA